MNITLTREEAQQVLDALQAVWKMDRSMKHSEAIETLRARLAQNEFNPDWDAMAVMVEEQQRMAKRIEELEARLAQPEPEPVAWISHNAGLYHGKPDELLNPLPLYTAPPKKEWVGLTDGEYELMAEKRVTNYFFNTLDYAHDIEAKLKEKNT